MSILNVSSVTILIISSVALADRPHSVPDSVYSQMVRIAKADTPYSQKLTEVRKLFCNGKTPRFSITSTGSFKPEVAPGVPLDQAAALKKAQLIEMRKALKGLAYKIASEGDQRPLEGSVDFIDDLAFLAGGYSFRIPQAQIMAITGLKELTASDLKHWGYDFKDNSYKPSRAIDGRDSMWAEVFEASTEITEAPQPDGSINYGHKLSFGYFCEYGIAITDLISR